MKASWPRPGVVLLAMLAFGLYVRADDIPATTGADSTATVWKTFTDPENRFSILMPGDPQISNGSDPANAAKPSYTSHIYMAKQGSGQAPNLYLAGITLYDPSVYDPSKTPDAVEKELAADRDNFNTAVSAHAISSQRRKFGEYPALEFKSASAQANFSGLVVLVGAHCYMVVTAYHTPDEPAEAVQFLQSFKLITP